MDNFVLYDEISSSDGVTVYKGRRKGTITFLAIYCIDKRLRAEITNQVRLTHELQHENVVRFAEWYETSNHLWLVVELCTGGTLGTLMKQDGRLPESCVRQFALDLVAGLHFVHSVGIVVGIMHPDGVHLDASGTLKLSDFKSARLDNENLAELYEQFAPGRQTSDSTNTLALDEDAEDDGESGIHDVKTASANKRPGTAVNATGEIEARFERLRPRLAYTPPEFIGRASSEWFSASSGCSIATDFWQLGCLLYEMFVGAPPFGDERGKDSADEIRNRILYQPIDFSLRDTHVQPTTVNHLPNAGSYAGTSASATASARQLKERPSAEFASLINLLLEKDARKRATWPTLIAHRFWRGDLERRVRAANASSFILDSATITAGNDSDGETDALDPVTNQLPQSRQGARKMDVPSSVRTLVAEDTKKANVLESQSESQSPSSTELESTVRQAAIDPLLNTNSSRPRTARNVEVERSEREPQPRGSSLANSSAYRSLLLTAQNVFAQNPGANASSDDGNLPAGAVTSAGAGNISGSSSGSVTAKEEIESGEITTINAMVSDSSANNRQPSAKVTQRGETSTTAMESDGESRRISSLNVAFAEAGTTQPGATTCASLVALLAKLCIVGPPSGSSSPSASAGKLLTAKYDVKLVPLSVAHFARLTRLNDSELAELCDVLATETRRTLFVGASAKQPPSAKALHCINFLMAVYSSASGIERLTTRLVRDGRFIAALANELTSTLPFNNAALVDFRVRTAYLFGMLLAVVTRVVTSSSVEGGGVVLDSTLSGALRAVLNSLVEQLRDQTAFRNARFRLVATHCVFQLCLLLASGNSTEKVSGAGADSQSSFALPNGVVALVVRIVRDCFSVPGAVGVVAGNASSALLSAADRGSSAPNGERDALASPNEPLSIAQLLLTLKFSELLLHAASSHTGRLLTAELVGALLGLLKPPQNDAVRAAALCVLVRACRSAPAAFHATFDKLSSEFHTALGELLAAYGNAPAAPAQSAANALSSRVLERALTLLLGATLTVPVSGDKQAAALLNRLVQAVPRTSTGSGSGSTVFLEILFKALDKATSPLLKAKIYLLVATLVRTNSPLLIECCQLKLVCYVERDLATAQRQIVRRPSVENQTQQESGSSPLNAALETLFISLEDLLPSIANEIVASIRSLRDRRHVAPAQVRATRSRLAFLNVLLFVAHSSVLRDRLVDSAFIRFLGALFSTLAELTLADANLDSLLDQRRAFAELLTYALTLLDSLVRAPYVLLHASPQSVDELLIGVLSLVRALLIDASSVAGGATNLTALRAHELAELRTAVARYATELAVGLLCELTVLEEHGETTVDSNGNGLAASGAREATERIVSLLNEHFLLHGETMLFDHPEPIATCYLRVLVACLDQLGGAAGQPQPTVSGSPAKFAATTALSDASLQTVSLVFETNLHQALLQYLHERLLDLSSFDVAQNTNQPRESAERHQAAVSLILDCFHLLFAYGSRLLVSSNQNAVNNAARFRECFDFALVDLLVRSYRVYVPVPATEATDDESTFELRAALVRCANALVTFVSDQTRCVLSATQQSKSITTPRASGPPTPFTAEQVEELLQSAKPLTALMPFCIFLLDPATERQRVLDETVVTQSDEDSELRRLALNVLSLLAQLYGGENLHLLSDRPAIDRFRRALESLSQRGGLKKLAEESARTMKARSIDDQRASRTLLRVLKRLIGTDKSYSTAIRKEGDSLIALLRTLKSTASSNADSNTQTLCSEILGKLEHHAQ